MKPSSKTEYALRTMLDLALHRKNGVSSVADIAQRQHIPAKFLEQILLGLKAGGLVTSRRGARGGYILAKEPSSISIGDIVRLTENSLASTRQKSGQEDPLAEVWEDIGNYAINKLATVTLEDMRTKVLEIRKNSTLEYEI
jgi:Rrf2 family protein